jgi:hypothetical protein
MNWKCSLTQIINGVVEPIDGEFKASENSVNIEVKFPKESIDKISKAVHKGEHYTLRLRAWNPAVDVESGPAADPEKKAAMLPLRVELQQLMERVQELERRLAA